ncbi:MAG: adenosylcobalamin-dependent ribonucleoside-diphosphate reductase [Candidatus Aenigmarchaeota archaeon]|nr:adenosylcobalamin-dependent ribonucleoside-diphosphate reductase [Candidatus Aenigmarchaeota archaeon]
MKNEVSMILEVKKRDGSVVKFERDKITGAIFKAACAVGGTDKKLAEELSSKVVEILKGENKPSPTVEEIQDAVEKVLIEGGHAKTAKAYILYRQKRAEMRQEKMLILEKEEIDEVDKRFDPNALRVLKARYLRKDENGKLIETPKQLFTRVATHGSLPDLMYDKRIHEKEGGCPEHEYEYFDHMFYDKKITIGKFILNMHHLEAVKRMYDRSNREGRMKISWGELLRMLLNKEFDSYEKNIQDFYDIMTHRKFMPNTPAIANFGSVLGMGSACFVIDIEDSIDDIMEKLKQTSIVFKAGGGMGYNFSKLRPDGDFVRSTCGVASGPITFMKLFDTMTEVIKQGGIRRGANMGIMNSNHPDIEKFITAKEGNKALRNFNISILIMSDFWDYYEKNEPYPLVNPRSGKIVKYADPKKLFDKVVYQAWESAEPGVLFFDNINKYNPFLKHLGPVVTTNPCGEVLLYGNESCNLGSVNVWAFAQEDGSIDWDDMKKTIMLGEKFLDNVIDVNKFPLKQIEEMTLATRKTGLGIMGVGDLLYEMGIPYNTDEGRNFMERLMEFINYWSKVEAIELAKERGSMLYYDKSFYPEGRMPFSGFNDRSSWHFDWDEIAEKAKTIGMRNGFTTVIAPTGSISMIAGCSSGIEPVYSICFEKNVKVGSFFYVDPAFERVMQREGLLDTQLMEDIATHGGTVQTIPYLSEHMKSIFVTANDITPEDHIRALAAFQRWTDSSISKTNNFPASATVEYMRESYLLAHKLGCKGCTVFRDSSIQDQVLVAPPKKEIKVETPLQHAKAAATTKGHTETSTMIAEIDDVSRKLSSNGNGSVPADEVESFTNPTIEGNDLGKFEPNNMEYDNLPSHKTDIKNCPSCDSSTVLKEGCVSCTECGWGLCS